MRIIILVIVLSIVSVAFSQESISGVIVKVYDGDTYSLKDSLNILRKIRLNGIDCPDNGQKFAKEATRYAKRLVLNKHVTVQYQKKKGSDQLFYGTMYVDSLNVNKQLLKEGYAWYYPFLIPSQEDYDLQQAAQLAEKGLWKDPKPVPPVEWREKEKKKRRKRNY